MKLQVYFSFTQHEFYSYRGARVLTVQTTLYSTYRGPRGIGGSEARPGRAGRGNFSRDVRIADLPTRTATYTRLVRPGEHVTRDAYYVRGDFCGTEPLPIELRKV